MADCCQSSTPKETCSGNFLLGGLVITVPSPGYGMVIYFLLRAVNLFNGSSSHPPPSADHPGNWQETQNCCCTPASPSNLFQVMLAQFSTVIMGPEPGPTLLRMPLFHGTIDIIYKIHCQSYVLQVFSWYICLLAPCMLVLIVLLCTLPLQIVWLYSNCNPSDAIFRNWLRK